MLIILIKIKKIEDIVMRIPAKSIVSNSDMMKNYKSCREMAELNGRIYILKNNQPDAVLFSISEYEKLSEIIEKIEDLDKDEVLEIAKTIKP